MGHQLHGRFTPLVCPYLCQVAEWATNSVGAVYFKDNDTSGLLDQWFALEVVGAAPGTVSRRQGGRGSWEVHGLNRLGGMGARGLGG